MFACTRSAAHEPSRLRYSSEETLPRQPGRREHTGPGLSWVLVPLRAEDGINYLHTDVLAYAAKIMAAVEGHEGIRCGRLLEHAGRPCGEPATYLAAGDDLVASEAPVDASSDVKSGPQWLCREHLELALGGPPEDQPVFGHLAGE